MASTYHLTEPYPNTTTKYTFTGRGGAGNITRNRPATTKLTESTSAAAESIKIDNLCLIQSSEPYPPPRNLSTATRPVRRRNYAFGRGGFGNSHPASERAMFSFDEELERAGKAAEAMAPIYHIGRGGSGNIVYDSDASSRSSHSSASSSSTIGTNNSSSTGRGFKSTLERVRSHFSRQSSFN